MILLSHKSSSKGLSALFIPLYDKTWASSRYRLYNYQPILEKYGICCEVLPPPPPVFLSKMIYLIKVLYKAKENDIVYIQKKIFKKLFFFILHKINKNIIFDFDDALFAKPTIVPADQFDIHLVRSRLNYVLRRSKTVVVGNNFLKNYVTPMNPNVYIIPTAVRLHKLLAHQNTSDKAVIGWIGRHENLLYISHLQRAFAHLNRKYKNRFMLKIISDEPLNLEDVIVINKRWSLENELADLSEIDIGIMPLGSDDWSKGKCSFKILQYMSMGIPVIASPIGMNKEVITHGVNGYLAETEEEWITYISKLISDHNLRKSLGYSGKQLVISNYTYEATAPLLMNVMAQSVRD